MFCNLLSVQNGFSPCYFRDQTCTIIVNSTNYEHDDHYCNFENNGYRLPTEGELEYLCRAGTTGTFSCDEPRYNSGNCNDCTGGTHPTLEQYCVYCANASSHAEVVGSKLPNPWSLKDVHGNVWEWCWDWYDSAYPSGSITDYTGPQTGSDRVVRGGGWGNGARDCRSADRGGYIPDGRYSGLGFRILRSIN